MTSDIPKSLSPVKLEKHLLTSLDRLYRRSLRLGYDLLDSSARDEIHETMRLINQLIHAVRTYARSNQKMTMQFPIPDDEFFSRLLRAGVPDEALTTLKHMATGGTNNRKGGFYEQMFALCCFLDESGKAASQNSDPLTCGVTLSNAATQYVDDLVVMNPATFEKENYQLKNSSTTGRVTQKLRDKFMWQAGVDAEFFPNYSATSYLVCSDAPTVAYNTGQNFNSLHLPYYPNATDYPTKPQGDFASAWQTFWNFCPDPNQHITALRLLTSGISGSQDLHITVGDWWEFVLDCAKPNIFTIPGSPRTLQIPPGVTLKLANLGFTVSRGVIDYVGMEFSITEELVSHLSALPESVVAEIETPAQMLEHLENAAQLEVDVDWLPPQAPPTSHSPTTTEDDL